MKQLYRVLTVAFFLALSGVPDLPAAEPGGKWDALAAKYAGEGDTLLEQGRPFEAIESYRRAIEAGVDHPDVYRNLSVTLFNLGLIDDAVVEMQRAVELAPDRDLFHMELGVLHLIRKEPDPARHHLFKALEENPGSADSYYYLAELFFQKAEYHYAWLAANMARRLGHGGRDIFRKLAGRQTEPAVNAWDRPYHGLYVRQIHVAGREKAEELLKRVQAGELFEDLAAELSKDQNGANGGYAGNFSPGELHPDIAAVLLESAPLAEPVIIRTGEEFQLVQRVIPFDFATWQQIASTPAGQSAAPVRTTDQPGGVASPAVNPSIPVITPRQTKKVISVLPAEPVPLPPQPPLPEPGNKGWDGWFHSIPK